MFDIEKTLALNIEIVKIVAYLYFIPENPENFED
jgi:hypothetical protein